MPYTIKESGVLREAVQDSITDPRIDAFIVDSDDAALTDDELDELYAEFNFGQCGCAHDCCGHRHGGVSSITQIFPGHYIMLVRSSLNY
jgi:hypothetical protein